MEPDFSGYVTKAGLKCSDGRTIMPDAFKHMDGATVPLLWQHGHNDPENVLGHMVLEHRADGVYGRGYFNDTPRAQHAKAMVKHKDVNKMSIWANQLFERAKQVMHGMIREVSLVLAGANPGALIDFIQIEHGDGDVTTSADEAIIYTGELLHLDAAMLVLDSAGATKVTELEHATEDMTVQQVYDSMDQVQQNVVNYMIGAALQAQQADNNASHGEGAGEDEDLEHKEGNEDMGVRNNVFEGQGGTQEGNKHVLSHSDMKEIVGNAPRFGGSLKASVEDFALRHGIENLEELFPDARTIGNTPEFQSRRMEWVAGVLNGTRHTPFSRIKSITADITQEEARAKGYITGHFKKEEWISVASRTTAPTTIYKKQKLDRDNIIDITDFDVVAWLKGEMRLMLEEELAGAILVGDGREVDDEDKIKDPMAAGSGEGIRSIVNEHELYAYTINVNVADASSSYDEVIDGVLDGMEFYKGSGNKTFYTTIKTLNMFLKIKDSTGRRIYSNPSDVAAALGVQRIVTVEVLQRGGADLIGIIVDLSDYNIGADRGGEVNLFDDFDIDYNQYKYLIETRLSGALIRMKSAMIIRSVASGAALVAPTTPSFDSETGVVTIPSKTGVTYKNKDTGSTISAGAMTALSAGASITVIAVPASGSYYFANNVEDEWFFKRPAA